MLIRLFQHTAVCCGLLGTSTACGGGLLSEPYKHQVTIHSELKQWGELWEDIYDSMMAMERRVNLLCHLKTFRPNFVLKG